jgi:hypothetical protein
MRYAVGLYDDAMGGAVAKGVADRYAVGMEAIGADLGLADDAAAAHTHQPMPVAPPAEPVAMKVALDGNRIVVSAVVGLKDARRLLKRLEANIALLEEENESGDEEAAN